MEETNNGPQNVEVSENVEIPQQEASQQRESQNTAAE